MGKFIDLTDQKFNRLYVEEFAYMNKWNQSCWKCLCVCGNEVIVVGKNLRNRDTKSCGCLKRETTIKRNKLGQSKEARKKISESHKGKKASIETRKKMSIINSGKNNPMYGIRKFGKNNPNYKPHLTDEDRQPGRNIPGYRQWHADVLKRDNWTCQVCGYKGRDIVAHHLESYNSNPKLRTTLSNGATVCEEHHIDFHHQYGYGNNTRKQFNEFKDNFKKENK